ncbi:uncharacterized protein LOC143241992 [Tachypleus tridentatus]|uniref:uncharacterized protein LOC143241992 n=1 Tax=Tachypleus tridentatus TaxID=6853 RepID=UPI003FD55578
MGKVLEIAYRNSRKSRGNTITPATSTGCFDYDPLFQCWDHSGLLTRRCNGALNHGEDSSVISSLCMFSDASAGTFNSPGSDLDSYSESVAKFGKCEDELVVLGVGLNTLMSGCPEEKLKTNQELLSGSKTRNMNQSLHSHNILVKRTNAVKFSPPPSSTGFSRDFQCHYAGCNKIYSKRSHLQAHLRRHSGEKPFVCQWPSCVWRFSRSDELARHNRSHSGIKPYFCEVCEKRFSRSDHLSKHMKIHKRDKLLTSQEK